MLDHESFELCSINPLNVKCEYKYPCDQCININKCSNGVINYINTSNGKSITFYVNKLGDYCVYIFYLCLHF
jgi:hypothetical protein